MAWIIGSFFLFLIFGGIYGVVFWAVIVGIGVVCGIGKAATEVAVHGLDEAVRRAEASTPEARAIEAEAQRAAAIERRKQQILGVRQ